MVCEKGDKGKEEGGKSFGNQFYFRLTLILIFLFLILLLFLFFMTL